VKKPEQQPIAATSEDSLNETEQHLVFRHPFRWDTKTLLTAIEGCGGHQTGWGRDCFPFIPVVCLGTPR
jgi:hypothetical protein